MLTRLAVKELRETARITLAVLAVYLFYFTDVTGAGRGDDDAWQRLSFIVDSSTGPGLGWVASLALAIGLGLRQTVGESARGTFQFLLHRPASRNQVIGTKLAVGMALCLVLGVVPPLLITWWATTPGTMPFPFECSMLTMLWRAWPAMTVLYLGAFLAGLRPGRWLGTRLLPVAAGFLVVLMLSIAPLPYWWAIGLPAIVLLDVLLVANILYVAQTRDFS